MTNYATEPMTFTAGRDWLRRKAVMPTKLNTRGIALKDPSRIRAHAFFSARVASAHILEQLRAEIEKIRRGEADYASARARLKTFLADQGYGQPAVDSPEDRDIQNLPSTHRLDLILRQNVGMAHAVAQREISENEAVKEIYPNYRYIANTERHARFDGLILPKEDPFWQTHYPPWDYNCKCLVVDTDQPVNGRTSIRTHKNGSQSGRISIEGRTMEVSPPRSGFVFHSDPKKVNREPDFDMVSDQALKEMLIAEWDRIMKMISKKRKEKST